MEMETIGTQLKYTNECMYDIPDNRVYTFKQMLKHILYVQ